MYKSEHYSKIVFTKHIIVVLLDEDVKFYGRNFLWNSFLATVMLFCMRIIHFYLRTEKVLFPQLVIMKLCLYVCIEFLITTIEVFFNFVCRQSFNGAWSAND